MRTTIISLISVSLLCAALPAQANTTGDSSFCCPPPGPLEDLASYSKVEVCQQPVGTVIIIVGDDAKADCGGDCNQGLVFFVLIVGDRNEVCTAGQDARGTIGFVTIS